MFRGHSRRFLCAAVAASKPRKQVRGEHPKQAWRVYQFTLDRTSTDEPLGLEIDCSHRFSAVIKAIEPDSLLGRCVTNPRSTAGVSGAEGGQRVATLTIAGKKQSSPATDLLPFVRSPAAAIAEIATPAPSESSGELETKKASSGIQLRLAAINGIPIIHSSQLPYLCKQASTISITLLATLPLASTQQQQRKDEGAGSEFYVYREGHEVIDDIIYYFTRSDKHLEHMRNSNGATAALRAKARAAASNIREQQLRRKAEVRGEAEKRETEATSSSAVKQNEMKVNKPEESMKPPQVSASALEVKSTLLTVDSTANESSDMDDLDKILGDLESAAPSSSSQKPSAPPHQPPPRRDSSSHKPSTPAPTNNRPREDRQHGKKLSKKERDLLKKKEKRMKWKERERELDELLESERLASVPVEL